MVSNQGFRHLEASPKLVESFQSVVILSRCRDEKEITMAWTEITRKDYERRSGRWIHISSARPKLIEECLGWGEIAEAFSRCCVVRSDDVLDVLFGVIGEFGLAWEVAP